VGLELDRGGGAGETVGRLVGWRSAEEGDWAGAERRRSGGGSKK